MWQSVLLSGLVAVLAFSCDWQLIVATFVSSSCCSYFDTMGYCYFCYGWLIVSTAATNTSWLFPPNMTNCAVVLLSQTTAPLLPTWPSLLLSALVAVIILCDCLFCCHFTSATSKQVYQTHKDWNDLSVFLLGLKAISPWYIFKSHPYIETFLVVDLCTLMHMV